MNELTKTPRSASTKEEVLAFLAVVVPLWIAFLHFATYAYGDDYPQICLAIWDPASWWNNLMAKEGRPLYGVMLLGAWRILQTIENGILLRLFGLTGVVLAGYMMSRFIFQRTHLSRLRASLVSAFMLLTPGIAVFTFWATAAPYSWSALSGWCGGVMAYEAWGQRKWRIWRLVGATILVIVAELIYQPTAGFFILPVVLLTVLEGKRDEVKKGAFIIIQYGLILVLYLVGFKVASHFVFEGNNPRADRVRELSEIPMNLKYHVLESIPLIGSGWAAMLGSSWTILAQLLVLFGSGTWMVTQLKRRGKLHGLLSVGFVVISLIVAGGPVFGAGTWAPFRTLVVTAAILFLIAGAGIASAVPEKWHARNIIVITGVLTATLFAREIVRRMVVYPNHTEYKALTRYFEREFDEIPYAVTMIPARREQPEENRGLMPQYEYGYYTSSYPIYLEYMFTVFITSRFNIRPGAEIAKILPDSVAIEKISPVPEWLSDEEPGISDYVWYHGYLIDFPGIMGQTPSPLLKADDDSPVRDAVIPVIGAVKVKASGWINHPQIGTFRQGPGGWIRHEIAGWLYPYPRNGDVFNLFRQDIGVYYGTLGSWPEFTSEDTGEIVNMEEMGPVKQLRKFYSTEDSY